MVGAEEAEISPLDQDWVIVPATISTITSSCSSTIGLVCFLPVVCPPQPCAHILISLPLPDVPDPSFDPDKHLLRTCSCCSCCSSGDADRADPFHDRGAGAVQEERPVLLREADMTSRPETVCERRSGRVEGVGAVWEQGGRSGRRRKIDEVMPEREGAGLGD